MSYDAGSGKFLRHVSFLRREILLPRVTFCILKISKILLRRVTFWNWSEIDKRQHSYVN